MTWAPHPSNANSGNQDIMTLWSGFPTNQIGSKAPETGEVVGLQEYNLRQDKRRSGTMRRRNVYFDLRRTWSSKWKRLRVNSIQHFEKKFFFELCSAFFLKADGRRQGGIDVSPSNSSIQSDESGANTSFINSLGPKLIGANLPDAAKQHRGKPYNGERPCR